MYHKTAQAHRHTLNTESYVSHTSDQHQKKTEREQHCTGLTEKTPQGLGLVKLPSVSLWASNRTHRIRWHHRVPSSNVVTCQGSDSPVQWVACTSHFLIHTMTRAPQDPTVVREIIDDSNDKIMMGANRAVNENKEDKSSKYTNVIKIYKNCYTASSIKKEED